MPSSAPIGTSAKDLFMVSNHVPSAGIAAIFVEEFKWKIDSGRKRKELNQETVGYCQLHRCCHASQWRGTRGCGDDANSVNSTNAVKCQQLFCIVCSICINCNDVIESYYIEIGDRAMNFT